MMMRNKYVIGLVYIDFRCIADLVLVHYLPLPLI